MRRIAARLVRPVALGTAVSLALVLTGCGSEPDPVPTPTVTVDPDTSVDKEAVPDPDLPPTWPLTGVESDDIAERPALAVKIENTAAARPQTGLENADVVWETIVEFEVSRFIAVFHSDLPGEVGPVRSARPMDVPITSPLHPLFVFSGAQRGILRDIDASVVQPVSHDGGAAGFSRSSARRAPHNVYAALPTMVESADSGHEDSPPQQFAFALEADQATAVLEGSDTSSIALSMSGAAKPSWDWDDSSSTWQRSEGSQAAVSASGDRLAATNVVVLEVQSVDSGYDAQGGAPVPALELEDADGTALVATGGKTVEARWSKEGVEDPIVLEVDSGPVELAPGNTWVEMLPRGSGSYSLG